jgi:thymidylate synthase (methanogen type)
MTHDEWQRTITTILRHGTTYVDGDGRRCTERTNHHITITDQSDIDEPYNALQDHDEWAYPAKEQLLAVIFDDKPLKSLDYTYGSRLLNFNNTINQIHDYIIPLLEDNSTSRRAIAQVYDPRHDSNQRRASTPGIIYLHFLIRNDALTCTACLRSNDVFIGFPANIIQIHHVHKWVADELNTDQGKTTLISNSAHIFHDTFHDIQDILNINPTALLKQ